MSTAKTAANKTAGKRSPAAKVAAKAPAARKPAAKPTAAPKPAAGTGSAAPSTRPSRANAIKLLTDDHKEVKALFKQYAKLVKADAQDAEKQRIAQEICIKLTAHATVEEEMFYPAAREVLGDDADLVDEADVEHASAKDLIAQIQASSPADSHYNAKVKVLGEYIDHHVAEEEGEMFPKVKAADLDLKALGADMAARKETLLAELGAQASNA